jgi:hypothetical protein
VGWHCDKFKFHLVSWYRVGSPISEEGLRVHNLLLFNQAFLGIVFGVMFV